MTRLVAVDVGGTHARFALASIENGTISLDEPVTLETAEHRGLDSAWQEFERLAGIALPRAAAVAIAGPVTGDTVAMTNSPWVLHISAFRREAGLDAVTVLNDFGAVAHAVAHAPADQLVHICGPDKPPPEYGTVSVIGPGTGLGVAHFHRFPGGYHVQATEGGHIGFAPQDELDDTILAALRHKHGRVATERVNAGPGSCRSITRSAAKGSPTIGRSGSAASTARTRWRRSRSSNSALRSVRPPATMPWRTGRARWCWPEGSA